MLNIFKLLLVINDEAEMTPVFWVNSDGRIFQLCHSQSLFSGPDKGVSSAPMSLFLCSQLLVNLLLTDSSKYIPSLCLSGFFGASLILSHSKTDYL